MQSSGHEPENSISSPILSPKNRRTLSGLTVLSLLHIVIYFGHLSRIHTFNLSILPGWYTDEDDREIRGYNHLSRQFWIDLGNNCPRLRHVIVDEIGDSFKREHWQVHLAPSLSQLRWLEQLYAVPPVKYTNHG